MQIAATVEELRQLNLRPTLDDFQNYWKNRLEALLQSQRYELFLLRTATAVPPRPAA